MPTQKEDTEFAVLMSESVDEVRMSSTSLDNAIEWIAERMSPDEVFSETKLSDWATSNGYTKE